MTITVPVIITCPVCGSNGELLHHDIRASLVYSCMKCTHEWQIDPREEPPRPDSLMAERPRARSARSKPRRKL